MSKACENLMASLSRAVLETEQFSDEIIHDRMVQNREKITIHGKMWTTPIEHLFWMALKFSSALEVTSLYIHPRPETLGYNEYEINISSQEQVCDWRVDYLITILNGDVRHRLIVECDGHDFHERTKEQAMRDRARDRRFQQLGYTVFRFTGAELYRDAFACAYQAIQWAEGRLGVNCMKRFPTNEIFDLGDKPPN